MELSWTQSFDFYMATTDGVPIAFLVDMAAHSHLPVVTHPTLLVVKVALKIPARNGLRNDKEFVEHTTAEDVLVDTLRDRADAIYVGRHMTQGTVWYHFYLPGDVADIDHAVISKFVRMPGYECQVALSEDPDWERYARLYPGSFHRNTMDNRVLQAQLEAQGDRLSRRRVVDHVAYFPSEAAANEAVPKLKKYKFATDQLGGPDDSGLYMLEFHRKDRCDGQYPDLASAQILDSIEPSGGEYDGWSCLVRR